MCFCGTERISWNGSDLWNGTERFVWNGCLSWNDSFGTDLDRFDANPADRSERQQENMTTFG